MRSLSVASQLRAVAGIVFICLFAIACGEKQQASQRSARSRRDSIAIYQAVLNDTALIHIIHQDFGDDPLRLSQRPDMPPDYQLSFAGKTVPIVPPGSIVQSEAIVRIDNAGQWIVGRAGQPIGVLTRSKARSTDTAVVSLWFDSNGRTGYFKLVRMPDQNWQVVSREFGKM